MKRSIKNLLSRILISLFTLFIPLMLCLYAVQAKKYTNLLGQIKDLEMRQEKLIEENKKLVSDIAILSSADRIEKKAEEELGMHKAETEDIVRVEMTGEKK